MADKSGEKNSEVSKLPADPHFPEISRPPPVGRSGVPLSLQHPRRPRKKNYSHQQASKAAPPATIALKTPRQAAPVAACGAPPCPSPALTLKKLPPAPFAKKRPRCKNWLAPGSPSTPPAAHKCRPCTPARAHFRANRRPARNPSKAPCPCPRLLIRRDTSP